MPSICEVMAGEFHDKQARGDAGGGGGAGGRALRRGRNRRTTSYSVAESPLEAEGGPENDVSDGRIKASAAAAAAAAAPARQGRRGEGTRRRGGEGSSREAAEGSHVGSGSFRSRKRDGGGGGGDDGGRSARLLVAAAAEDAIAGANANAVADADCGGGGKHGEASAGPEETAGLLPIHQLLRILGPRGYRGRG